VRLAVGYNPYQRPKGPIYYEATELADAPLLCVSPNNFIPTHITYDTDGTTVTKITQDQGLACPGTYQPARETSLRSKLTFSFAIGQAF